MNGRHSVSLILPEKVPAALGQLVPISVGVTDFSGTDREILVRLIGSLTGPLPAVSRQLPAHLSIQTEVSLQVPSGMPVGEHPVLIEVLDRSTGSVIGQGEVLLDVQHTQAIRMHLSPPSIRRRLRGRIRIVLRNHDDETHNIRIRAESDDSHTKIKLWHQDVELRAGEMVRLKARLRVKPFFIGKQKEHWYSIIGDGAGVPIYGRGNVRHIPMIGRNIKSLMGLMCIVLVWAGATLAIIKAVNPVTTESTASAEEGGDDTGESGADSGGELELPNLVEVTGTVTATPDGSGVVVKWRPVSIGDIEGSGKVGGQSTSSNPNVANLSTSTDADGAFTVAGLDGAGLYEFTFSKAGHSTKTMIVQPKGEPVTLEVELAVGDGTVAGLTVDESGQPLGGVDVKLTDGTIIYQTTTPTEGDQKGRFTFKNLSTPATYVIDARVSQRGLASTTFYLDAGSSSNDVTLTLSPNVTTLAGRVSSVLFDNGTTGSRQPASTQTTSASSVALPAVTITATDGSITARSTTSLTDIDQAGKFRLEELPINRVYTVSYSVEGYTTYSETVELTLDTPERDISLNRATGRLSGNIVVNSPDILPQSVAISVENSLQTYKSSDLVRADGTYDFSGIAPGRYVVTYEALGLKDQYREIDIGAGTTAIVDVTMTELDDTSRSSSLNFLITKTGEEADSPEPENVFVSVRHRAPNDCGRIITEDGVIDTDCEYPTKIEEDATTSVLIDQLDAGAYYLVFSATGFSPKVVQTNVALGETKDQIAVTLDALGTLSGQVTDDSGSPVEGVQLLLTSATGVTKTGGTGPNGEFTFPNSLDAMTYTLGTTSPNFTSVSRTVTGALNASVNVDATVRGISMITGEVRSLNLASGNYEAVEAKNFSVFYRISPTGSTVSTGGWVDTKTIGISKSLGSFRLGVNPKDQNNNPIFIDACVTIIDGTIAGTVMSSEACDSSLLKSAMPRGLIAKTSTTVTLQTGETVVRSVYFTPSPGSVSGYVTVGDVAENNVKIEARRIGPDGRIYETVNATSTTNSGNQQSGYYIFEYLTPTSSVAPDGYNENVFVPCDQTVNICWSIRATKTSVGSSDSRPFTIYPSKRLNLPATETIDIELGRGSASVTLSTDTGVIFSNTDLTLTATINGVERTSTEKTNASGKAIFSNLEIGTWTLSLPATDDYALVNREFNITQGVSLNESVVRRSLRGKLIVYLRGPGGPLSGAEIRLAPSSDSTSTTTTPTSTTTTIAGTPDPTVLCVSVADGSCTINNYDSGVHTFVASAAGLSSTTISASVIGGQTIAVSVVLGAASGSLTVTLLDVLGKPLPGAIITAKDQNLVDYSCTTNATGICSIIGIPFGIVDVKGSAPDFRDSFGSISIGNGGSAMTLIATPTNGKATFVFVDDNGQGIFPALAEYIDSNGLVLKSCAAPTTNQCIITGLPQGLVTIRATVTGVDASQYAPVTLKVSVFPGLDTAATFVIPTANAALAGTVVEDVAGGLSSVKISGAIVTATNGTGESVVTLTDDAGKYSFSTLTPGSWTIRATAPGYATKTLPAITLPNQTLEIRLVPLSGSIELSVRTPIGGPASGITVTVQRMTANADIYSIVTSVDGNAFFAQDTIVEGTYTVTLSDSIIPARFVSQTFVLNVDRGAATRFATYLGTFGAFVAVPIAGIPASGFGPGTPLSVDVALIKNGVLTHQISTEMVAGQRVASFAGVAPGQYSIAIQSPGLIASSTPVSINNVVRNFTDKVRFTTSSDHGLVLGDFVDISGFAKTIFNFDNAEVTEFVDARTFSVSRVTGTVPLPVGDEYANAKVVKVSNQTQWNLAAHTINSGSMTYDVPSAPTIEVPELSRTIALGVINLIVKPVDFDVVVSGIAFTDPSITTTTTPSSTTLPLLGNAKVTLSDGYLLNSVSSTTNSSGVANFTDIPPGTYTATVTNTSYDDFVTTIQVVDFADPAGNNPRISLNQSPIVGTIKVTVFGDGNSSNYVSGATVSVLENNATCVTDVSGMCNLKNLAQGDYNLRVIHPSYATINTSTIHVTGGLETTHSVGLGANEGQVDFTVFNSATGLPIASSEITAQVTGTAPSCTTNASGKCSVTDLALGATSFRIEAVNPATGKDFAVGFAAVDVGGGIPTKISVNLNPSDNTLMINTVDAVTGAALAGVSIDLNSDQVCTTSIIAPSTAASCTSARLAAGSYPLTITKSGYEDLYETVSVLPDAPTSLTFALRPTFGTVQFIVKDAASGALIPSAVIESVNDNTDTCTTPTGASTTGRCSIANLALVATQFEVTAPTYNGGSTNVTVSNVAGSETVVLLNKETVGFRVYTFDAVTDTALNGIKVEYANGDDFCSAVTATGFCQPATNIPGGTITLKAYKDGAYLPIFATTTFSTSEPASLTLALLPTNGVVDISVVNGNDDSEINGVVITRSPSESVCTTTGGAGCTVSSMPVGTYVFTATKVGFTTATTTATIVNSDTSYISLTMYPVTNTSLRVYTYDANTGSSLDGVSVTSCTGNTSSGYCTANNVATGQLTITASRSGYDNAYGNVMIESGGSETVHLYLRPTASTLTVTVLNSFSNAAIPGAWVSITGGYCGSTSGSGVIACTGFTSGNLSLSVSASYFSSASATVAIARGSTNSVVLFLTPWGQLTVSSTKKAALITVSIQNYGGLCSIPALSGTEPPGPGECTGYNLPYGTYIVSLDTSPVKTATVTINKTSTSVNIP